MYKTLVNICFKKEGTILKRKSRKKTVSKITFYIISLWMLFCSAAIISTRINLKTNLIDNLKNNFLAIVFFALAIVSFSLQLIVKDKIKGTVNPTYKIIKLENKNYEFLTYLTAFIIPLVFIDFTKIKYLIVLVLILLFTGFVFAKMDLFLANPTLALFYKLYEIEVEIEGENKRITVITKDKLKKNDDIEWLPFDDQCWYVRRVENGKF